MNKCQMRVRHGFAAPGVQFPIFPVQYFCSPNSLPKKIPNGSREMLFPPPRNMKILESKNLLFRHLEPGDLDELFVLYSDPEVRRYFPEGILTLEETKDELDWFLNGHPEHHELGLWATIHKESGRFIGRCGLLPWIIEQRLEVEVAYMLAKEYWGQGLGTEAARAILEYGFEKLDLSSVICLVDRENLASRRVAKKIGMELEREGRDDKGPYLLYRCERKAYYSRPERPAVP